MTVDLMQGQDYDTDNYIYLTGSAPLLQNEIAVSSKIAKSFGLMIGDTVTIKMAEDIDSFLIAAIYPALSNSGSSVRVSETFTLSPGNESFVSFYGNYTDLSVNHDKAFEEMHESFPDISISTETDMYNRYIGGPVAAVDSMKNLIVGVVLCIVFMITCLIVRILISREVSELALLKSIGFRRSHLRRWQIMRIVIVLTLSIAIGTTIAGPVSGFILNTVFNMLGVPEVTLIIDPLQVYLIYPFLLFITTTIAAAISIGLIKKTQVWEVNNQE